MYDRLISLVGETSFLEIQKAKVLLLGVGGVGGYVAEGLVRSGISQLTVIDGDVIDESNLNRQIIALNSTIGQDKVDVLAHRLKDIAPKLNLTTHNKVLIPKDVCNLNLEAYDYVIDAIDDLPVKIELAKYCLEKEIKLISSMGTARKMKPEMLAITSLDKTSYDPLAKAMRMALRGYDTKKLLVVASTESPLSCPEGTLGSAIFVPATAGLLVADYVICDIIKRELK